MQLSKKVKGFSVYKNKCTVCGIQLTNKPIIYLIQGHAQTVMNQHYLTPCKLNQTYP